MTSVRARVGALLTAPLAAASLAVSMVVAVPMASASAAAATTTVAAGRAPAVAVRTVIAAPQVSRSGRVVVSRATLHNPILRGRVVIAVARLYRGIRYTAGGTTPRTGFDCSGYTRYVFARLGIKIPRVSRDQYRAEIHISRAKAVPGDLVFFHSSSGRVYHAALYAGGGYVWHSPHTGDHVKREKIWTSAVYYARVRV